MIALALTSQAARPYPLTFELAAANLPQAIVSHTAQDERMTLTTGIRTLIAHNSTTHSARIARRALGRYSTARESK